MKKHIDYTKAKSGFTMVELSITLAFIGVLLITIAVITTNIVTIYQKGMALKAVNSVGRGLIDDFISSIDSAPSVDTTSICRSLLGASDDNEEGKNAISNCVKDHAYKYIYRSIETEVPIDSDEAPRQLSGIFCTGSYSYIWNTYYGISEGSTIGIKYKTSDKDEVQQLPNNDNPEPIRLARFKDPNYRLCSATVNNKYEFENIEYDDGIEYIDITSLSYKINDSDSTSAVYNISEPTQGMLDSFDLELYLYQLTIFPISQDSVSLRTYMAGTFILATGRGNIDILRSGDYCQPGVYNEKGDLEGDTSSLNNLGSEFNYCAINKFNFAGRTAGV